VPASPVAKVTGAGESRPAPVPMRNDDTAPVAKPTLDRRRRALIATESMAYCANEHAIKTGI